MDRYEKSAEWIMKYGEDIIAKKKRKTGIIRNIAFSVSGLCAAVLICFGIWKTPELQKPPEIPEISAITTDAQAEKTVTTAKNDADAEEKTTVASSKSAAGIQTTVAMSESSTVSIHTVSTVSVNTIVQSEVQIRATDASPVQTTQVIAETTLIVTTQNQTESGNETSVPLQLENPSFSKEPELTEYSFLRMDELGGTYILTSSIDPAFVDDHIKNTVLTGTSSQGEIKSRAAIYSVQGIAPEVMTAVTFGSQDSYSVYCNYSYKPATLGEFMEAAGITRYASLDKAYYYDLSNGYEERYYTGIDTQKVIDMLLGCSGAECYSYSELTADRIVADLSLDCDMSSAIPLSVGFGVNRAGYLTTNLASGGLAFNIGIENAEGVIRMITENYQYTVKAENSDSYEECNSFE